MRGRYFPENNKNLEALNNELTHRDNEQAYQYASTVDGRQFGRRVLRTVHGVKPDKQVSFLEVEFNF